MTVQQLRNMGYKVRVLHNRLYNGYHKWQVGAVESAKHHYGPIDPDSKGGSTEVIIDSPSGQHFQGLAICSKKENYNKKLGVRIAIGRCGIDLLNDVGRCGNELIKNYESHKNNVPAR